MGPVRFDASGATHAKVAPLPANRFKTCRLFTHRFPQRNLRLKYTALPSVFLNVLAFSNHLFLTSNHNTKNYLIAVCTDKALVVIRESLDALPDKTSSRFRRRYKSSVDKMCER